MAAGPEIATSVARSRPWENVASTSGYGGGGGGGQSSYGSGGYGSSGGYGTTGYGGYGAGNPPPISKLEVDRPAGCKLYSFISVSCNNGKSDDSLMILLATSASN
jgi:hypothetical protein